MVEFKVFIAVTFKHTRACARHFIIQRINWQTLLHHIMIIPFCYVNERFLEYLFAPKITIIRMN